MRDEEGFKLYELYCTMKFTKIIKAKMFTYKFVRARISYNVLLFNLKNLLVITMYHQEAISTKVCANPFSRYFTGSENIDLLICKVITIQPVAGCECLYQIAWQSFQNGGQADRLVWLRIACGFRQ